MIGSIPNPKKTITIEFPIASIREAVKLIKDITNNYTLSDTNDILNLYTYSATETLSFGVFIDINLSSKNDNSTDVTIEVRRKIGTFDQSHEVTSANQHIQNIVTLISNALQLTEAQKQEINAKYIPKEASLRGEKAQKYNCGICKKSFYADNTVSLVVICPHCKKNNTIPKPSAKKGCLGVVAALIVFAASSIYLMSILILSIFA
jgi:hypothetical protein